MSNYSVKIIQFETSKLTLHPEAAIVPAKTDDEYCLLCEDLDKNGIQDPLHGTANGVVLDGRHRLRWAKQRGLKTVPVKIVDPADAFVYLCERALSQKQLTPMQRDDIAEALTIHLKARAKENQRVGGKQKGSTELSKAENVRQARAHAAGNSEGTTAKIIKIKELGGQMFRDENGAVALDKVTGAVLPPPPNVPSILEMTRREDLSIDGAYRLIKSAQKKQDLIRRALSAPDAPLPPSDQRVDVIFVGDSWGDGNGKAPDAYERIPKESVALVFTSFPYPIPGDKVSYPQYEYDGDYQKFLRQIEAFLKEAHRVLRDGGRLALECCVCSAFGIGEDQPLMLDVPGDVSAIARRLGFQMRDKALWWKQKCDGKRRAVGSVCSPASPRLMRNWEEILVFNKGSKYLEGDPRLIDIQPADFDKWTVGYWPIKPVTQAESEHRCAFPLELARRVIQLYTYRGDTVLDPFSGSGTTCMAAKLLGRRWIGIDNDEIQVKKAIQRLAEMAERFDVPPLPSTDSRN